MSRREGRSGKFFEHGSAYILGEETAGRLDEELSARWDWQRAVDDAIAAVAGGRDQEAMVLTGRLVSRPSVFVGLPARMVGRGGAALIDFVRDALERDPTLAARFFGGRTLLHYAAGAGCLAVVDTLLRLGADASVRDSGGHTPLYSVANECASDAGPEIVLALVRAGADVNACGGVTRATPLHMSARRGKVEIARALLDCGADLEARDHGGDTPLQRALNCRKAAVAQFLMARGAHAGAKT